MALPIDITVAYKGLKSPAVPPCLKTCGEELVSRIKTGQLRTFPSCWSALVSRSTARRESEAHDVEELLQMLSAESMNHVTGNMEESHRIPECAILPTHHIFAVLCEFLQRCQKSLCVQLSYPTTGWIIFGPASINEAQYTKEMHVLLESLYDQAPIRRDMLCYIMAILATLILDVNETCRDQPALGALTRYQIAHQFAPMLFRIYCEKCRVELDESSRTCIYCGVIVQQLKKPFVVDVMDRLLRHLSVEFWKNTTTNEPTSRLISTTQLDSEQVHSEIVNMLTRQSYKPIVKTNSKERPSPVRHRASLINMQLPAVVNTGAKDQSIARKKSVELPPSNAVHGSVCFVNIPGDEGSSPDDYVQDKPKERIARRSRKASQMKRRSTSGSRARRRVSRRATSLRPGRRVTRSKVSQVTGRPSRRRRYTSAH